MMVLRPVRRRRRHRDRRHQDRRHRHHPLLLAASAAGVQMARVAATAREQRIGVANRQKIAGCAKGLGARLEVD